MIHDGFTVSSDNVNHAARIWLMASYLYYLRPDLDSFLTDNEFDGITQILIENYKQLTVPQKFPNGGENPPLSTLISMEDLDAGSGFALREHDYPNITKHAAIAMTEDKFWTLKQEIIFRFPYTDRVGTRYDLPTSKVSDCFDRNMIVSRIYHNEPLLQNPDRYYQGDSYDELYDKSREQDGILLKDREAEEFFNGLLSMVNESMQDGLVLGNVIYRENVGWIALAYDTTRAFYIGKV